MINGYISVVDSDKGMVVGGEEGSYRDPEIRWEPDLKEIYFGLSSLTLV